jgi:hypothetical protein
MGPHQPKPNARNDLHDGKLQSWQKTAVFNKATKSTPPRGVDKAAKASVRESRRARDNPLENVDRPKRQIAPEAALQRFLAPASDV